MDEGRVRLACCIGYGAEHSAELYSTYGVERLNRRSNAAPRTSVFFPNKRPRDGGGPSRDSASSTERKALAKRNGVSPTTVQIWRKRSSVADAPMGPKEFCPAVLTTEEEAIVVAFRRHTLLSLDDCLFSRQPTIPHLTRCHCTAVCSVMGSADCRRSMATSRRPSALRITPPAIFISRSLKVRTDEGKLHLFVAI